MNNTVYTIMFLFIVIVSLFLPGCKNYTVAEIVPAVFSICAVFYIYRTRFSLFVPALFFLINTLLGPLTFRLTEALPVSIPQIYFLLPISVYIIVVLSGSKTRKYIKWTKIGKLDGLTVILIFIMTMLTGAALFMWTHFLKIDLDNYQHFIPDIPIPMLIFYGLLFPALNSLFEEFMARAVLFDGFSAIFNNTASVIIMQALIFSLWHYNGFPGGIAGVVMVFIWSIFLGIIRYRSGGMLAPLSAHYLADLSIALILFFRLILPRIQQA